MYTLAYILVGQLFTRWRDLVQVGKNLNIFREELVQELVHTWPSGPALAKVTGVLLIHWDTLIYICDFLMLIDFLNYTWGHTKKSKLYENTFPAILKKKSF